MLISLTATTLPVLKLGSEPDTKKGDGVSTPPPRNG